jgi:hypothetical protein
MRTYPLILSDTSDNFLDIGPVLLTQVSDLIDKSDAGGEVIVGCILAHLRALWFHQNNIFRKWEVELREDIAGTV